MLRKPIKTFILLVSFFFTGHLSYGQKQLLSYEDLKYIIENNIGKADTFMVAKGYTVTKMNIKKKTRTFGATMQGGTKTSVEIRADGRKMFVEIQTDDISQYNMIYNSISQFLISSGSVPADIQSYNVKELGMIYISINDKVPYSPIRKDYDIHLVADKNITSYN